MVLEGLKRAEQLITLLRGAGYSANRLKPEHLDQEFESRQYSSALSALLGGLGARVLSNDEVARLEYIASLGLLEGLLDSIDDEEERTEPSGPAVTRLEELVRLYEGMLEEQALEEERLRLELENTRLDAEIEERDYVSCVQNMSNASCGRSSVLRGLLDEITALLKDAEAALQDEFRALRTPIDHSAAADGAMRFKSVSNDELLLRPFHPDDHQLYVDKIDAAIAALARRDIHVSRDELLEGERELALIRFRNHQAILQRLIEFKTRLASFGLIVGTTLKRHSAFLLANADSLAQALMAAGTKANELQHYLDAVAPDGRYDLPSMQADSPADLTQLQGRLDGLDTAHHSLRTLVARIVNEAAEIDPIPEEIRTSEGRLRDVSLEVSEALSRATTEASRLRLLFQGSVQS